MKWTATARGYEAETDRGRARLSKVGGRWVLTLGERRADLGRRASFDTAEGRLQQWGVTG